MMSPPWGGRSVPARRGHGPAVGPGRAGTGGDTGDSGSRGGLARLGPAWPGPARLVPARGGSSPRSARLLSGGRAGSPALPRSATGQRGGRDPPPHSPPGRGAGARRGWAKGLTGCGALLAQRGAPARLTAPRPSRDRRPFLRGSAEPRAGVAVAGAGGGRGRGAGCPRSVSGRWILAALERLQRHPGAGRRRLLSQSRPKSPSRSSPDGPGQGSRLSAACPPPCCPSLGGTHRCHGCPETGTARLCQGWARGGLPDPLRCPDSCGSVGSDRWRGAGLVPRRPGLTPAAAAAAA